MPISSGPIQQVDSERAKTSALAALWGAVWEATGFLSYDEVREYVEGTLREVESDRP